MPSKRVRGHRVDDTVKSSTARLDKRKTKKDDVVSDDISINHGSDHCGSCGKEVLEDQPGLKCDCCAMWFHLRCEKVADDVYDFLIVHDDEKSICWYCKRCTTVLRSVLMSVTRLEEGQRRLEDKVDKIANALDNKAAEWPTCVEQSQRHLNEKVDTLMNIVEEKAVDPMRMHDCVEDVLRAQLQEDKEEEEEIRKRKTSVIVHGLQESAASTADVRLQDDGVLIEDLLHKLESDEVSVNKIIRLGKRSDDSETKPRPVKLELASEEQKDMVLKRTKNLAKYKEGVFAGVFLHQDLTPKQRKKRQELVKQMKERQSKGEKNLIIVNWKIVERRTNRVFQREIQD